jgi:hypothetical protein
MLWIDQHFSRPGPPAKVNFRDLIGQASALQDARVAAFSQSAPARFNGQEDQPNIVLRESLFEQFPGGFPIAHP